MKLILLKVLARCTRYFPLLTVRLLNRNSISDIKAQSMRHVRVVALKEQSRRLGKVMEKLGFGQNILVRADGNILGYIRLSQIVIQL